MILQDLITDILLGETPDYALYGEEGVAGNQDSDYQWIVDPIDGTVNFFYGIPHYCISIALRHKDDIIVGVIYDPSMDDLWTVTKGEKPYLNGKEISCSSRTKLEESILYVGCGKTEDALSTGLYIATGRLDAYVESRISLWDIAAGKLLIESTGGSVTLTPKENAPDVMSIIATNGKIPIEEIL